MASELGLSPPPAKRPPTAPTTTITDIGDDLLREIFILLPSLPSIVRAALACTTFLHAVRSSPAFRRRFQSLHPPQILGFFDDPDRPAIPPFFPLRRRSDPDLAAAVRGSDFFLTRLPGDSADSSTGWAIESCHGGYVVLVNGTTDQIAAYNPLTQALDIFPLPPQMFLYTYLEFQIVISEEDQGILRMLFVQHRDRETSQLRVAAFSSATREWQILPWVDTPRPEEDAPPPTPQPQPEEEEDGEDMPTYHTGTQVNGSAYWKHASQAYMLVLNTATLQFSRMDLPVYLREIDSDRFKLGQTKDGKLCMAVIDFYEVESGMLVVKFWGAGDDGVEKWILEGTYPLNMFVDATKPSMEDDDEDGITVQLEAIIDGYVYLSTKYNAHTQSLKSLCLETSMVNRLFDDTYPSPAFPYVMAWPPSLVYKKGDSQTKVTGVPT